MRLWRATYPLVIYWVLVALGIQVHEALRSILSSEISWRSVTYVIAGPALALETHMALLLFPLESVVLIPLLYVALLVPARRHVFGTSFIVGWLLTGWLHHELFL